MLTTPAPRRKPFTARLDRLRRDRYSGGPSPSPPPEPDGDGAGVVGAGDDGVDGTPVGAGDGDDGGRDGNGNDGVGSGGGGGGSFASGWHANNTPISTASSSNPAASVNTVPTRLRCGARSPTGTGPPAPGGGPGRSNAGSADPSQYGWNCGPRRRPPHHVRPEPWNTTGSRNRSAPARSASYDVATHGAGPSGCAATTGAGSPGPRDPPPLPPPKPPEPPGPRPGTAALIAARNRSRAAASSAAPRFSTATLARRPSPSTPRNTIPAADSDKRADKRNGPSRSGSPGGNGLDMAATLTTTPYDRLKDQPAPPRTPAAHPPPPRPNHPTPPRPAPTRP
ncbi:hypothetical protein ACH35V_39485 [Actinomadura sp. 1N219]|uniref:hypothetical protein n=1 Tax=Actinomadura sp. 1N219 TaxID=3375152 RepID=UPI00378BF1A8